MTQNTFPQLPPQVAAYVGATNAHDAAGIARCFAPDGTVRDEGHTHSGHADIAAWAEQVAARYAATMAPDSGAEADGQYLLRAQVSGNFPGSPVLLAFRFVLQAGAIASLEIGA